MQNLYKYETHLHTGLVSYCSSASTKHILDLYTSQDYDGVFVTDHFFNSNNYSNKILGMNWNDKIEYQFKGYEDLLNEKEKGNYKLDIFFGMEFTYHSNDFLFYNISKEFLKDLGEYIMIIPLTELFERIHYANGFIVHAHPFYKRPYVVENIYLPMYEDAVEVYNGNIDLNHDSNKLARAYAEEYETPITAGSDYHGSLEYIKDERNKQAYLSRLTGILSYNKFNESMDYLNALRNRKTEIIKH